MKIIGRLLPISLRLILVVLSSVSLYAVDEEVPLDEEPHNPWRQDTDAALNEFKGNAKIILLSAEWCHWCKVLKDESAESPEMQELLSKIPGIVIDTDVYKELMAYYGLQGLPALLLVNAKEEVVTAHVGYMPMPQLVTMLQQWKTMSADKGIVPSGLYPEMDFDVMKETGGMEAVIAKVGFGTNRQRGYLRERLAEEAGIATFMWPLLTHTELCVRIDASAVLQRCGGDFSDYDAFSSVAERKAGAARWQKAFVALPITKKQPVEDNDEEEELDIP